MRLYFAFVTVLAINAAFVGCSNDLGKFKARVKDDIVSDASAVRSSEVDSNYQASIDSKGGNASDKSSAGSGNDTSSNGDNAGSNGADNNAGTTSTKDTTGGTGESGGTGGSTEAAGSPGSAGSGPTNPGPIRVRGGITTVQAAAVGSGTIRLVESALHVNPRACDADNKICVVGWFDR